MLLESILPGLDWTSGLEVLALKFLRIGSAALRVLRPHERMVCALRIRCGILVAFAEIVSVVIGRAERVVLARHVVELRAELSCFDRLFVGLMDRLHA